MNVDTARLYELCEIVMPFGKYEGECLGQIPLQYLDMIVSQMPPSWIVRRVQEFIDITMDLLQERGESVGQIPVMSLCEIAEKRKPKE
jgi:uncharacterized protein (DUF3820 family)